MDSVKFNVFTFIIFVTSVINSSSNLLFDDEEKAIPQSIRKNKPNLLYEIRHWIDLFLRIKRRKPTYLIWLLIDFSVGFYLISNSAVYGFGSRSLILHLENKNLITNILKYYQYSLTGNRVMSILLIETYLNRIRYIMRSMSVKNSHQQKNLIDETTSYFANLNLTLRAWLHIMDFTDQVRCKDAVHCYEINSCTTPDEKSKIKVPLTSKSRRGTTCTVSNEEPSYNGDYNDFGEVGHKGPPPHNSFYQNHCRCIRSYCSEKTNKGEELFNYEDEFKEINYQLKFPKQLLRNGTPHKVNMLQMRLLCNLNNGTIVFIVILSIIFARAMILMEYNKCNDSFLLFVSKRFFPLSLLIGTVINLTFQMIDVARFIIDCILCYNKADITLKFTQRTIQLYRCHRERVDSLIVSGTYKTYRKANYNYDSNNKQTAVNNVILNNEINRKSLDRRQFASTSIEQEHTRLSELSMNIDRLIRMITELRSDLNQLKRFFTIYLHLELVFKIPCVIYTVATLMRLPYLTSLELQVLFISFLGFALPIIMICYSTALIESQVNITSMHANRFTPFQLVNSYIL